MESCVVVESTTAVAVGPKKKAEIRNDVEWRPQKKGGKGYQTNHNMHFGRCPDLKTENENLE